MTMLYAKCTYRPLNIVSKTCSYWKINCYCFRNVTILSYLIKLSYFCCTFFLLKTNVDQKTPRSKDLDSNLIILTENSAFSLQECDIGNK